MVGPNRTRRTILVFIATKILFHQLTSLYQEELSQGLGCGS